MVTLLFLLLGLLIDSSSSEETMMTPRGTMARDLGVRDPISSLSGLGLGDNGGEEAMDSSSMSSTRRVGKKEEDRVKNK